MRYVALDAGVPITQIDAYDRGMATHIRKNVVLPEELDERLRRLAKERGSSQSGLISHLLTLGLAAEEADGDPLLRYLGALAGPADLSSTVDKTVYRR
jgi:hypothetical protein